MAVTPEEFREHLAAWKPCPLREAAIPAALAERNRQLLALRLASPKRSVAPQHDVDGLGLFDTVRQPSLF